MNDNIWLALETHLDAAVAPIAARSARKLQMREEMLAHLVDLYERELARLGDENAALDAAIGHFGPADRLGDDLKYSVPFWERVGFLILGKKESIMWRLFMLIGCVGVLVGLGFIFPAVAQLLREAGWLEPGLHHYSGGRVITLAIALLLLGCAISASGAWSMAHGIKRFRMRNS